MTRLLLAGVAALVALTTAAVAELARPIDKDDHSYAGPNVPFRCRVCALRRSGDYPRSQHHDLCP